MELAHLLNHFDDVSDHGDGGYIARCPVPSHGDSRPSLRIWRGDDNKVRITCRAGCETEKVIKAVGLTWSALFNATGEGGTVSKGPPALVGAGPIAGLRMFLNSLSVTGESLVYAKERFGLDLAALNDLGVVGFDPAEDSTTFPAVTRAFTDFPRMVVPLFGFDGVARGLQGRDLSGSCPGRWVGLRNPQGNRWALYGVFRGTGGYGATVITEGPSDALTAVALGYDVVFIRGASLAANPDLVAELADGLRGTQVVVAGDNDNAGSTFTERLSQGLAKHDIEVYALAIPRRGDDLNAWRMRDVEGFPAAFHRAVANAKIARIAAEAQESREISTRTGADSVSADEGSEAVRIIAGLLARFGESDAMNAHALVAWTNGRIRYSPGLGFLVWNGCVWIQSNLMVRQEIHRMGAALVLSGALKESRGFTMTTRINDLITELKSVPNVHTDADEFDARPDLLSFRNGVVDLRTGELRPHDPADMLTTTLPADYYPEAKCPRWESFLEEIMPGMADMVGYLRRLVGYGITGHTSEQCFVVMWGKGANGKSVFSETISSVFSTITTTTPFATFESKGNSGGIPNDIAALRGARLVMASEGESNKDMSEAIIKRLSGKDRVTARFLNKEFFTYQPNFLILLATNHKPGFKSQDEGLWRRVKLVPFRRFFAPHERDYELDQKLLTESSGIIAWAVRGAIEWYASGLQDPGVVRNATREYRETSDRLAGFFPDILKPTDGNERLDGTDAYNAYRDWCEAEGLQSREVWSRTMFYRAMEERGIQRKRTSRGQALIGVALEPAPPPSGPGIFNK